MCYIDADMYAKLLMVFVLVLTICVSRKGQVSAISLASEIFSPQAETPLPDPTPVPPLPFPCALVNTLPNKDVTSSDRCVFVTRECAEANDNLINYLAIRK